MSTTQSPLPTSETSFPHLARDNETGGIFLLLGIDMNRRGHYWLHSSWLHSVVLSAEERFTDVRRETWLSNSQLATYLDEREWMQITDFARWKA